MVTTKKHSSYSMSNKDRGRPSKSFTMSRETIEDLEMLADTWGETKSRVVEMLVKEAVEKIKRTPLTDCDDSPYLSV